MMHVTDPVPTVPLGHFTKVQVSLDDAWHLVGPTIGRNRHRGFQALLCIAFVEGMRMALHVSQEKEERHD